jgi:hypothetical protein
MQMMELLRPSKNNSIVVCTSSETSTRIEDEYSVVKADREREGVIDDELYQ